MRRWCAGAQDLTPLFEFSGACAGCGETPYLRLLTQLFGDRLLVANATGCSSIYGGNLPTTPWSVNKQGRGPAWANSLFEDNAEFGLGFRLSLDKQREEAERLLAQLAPQLGPARVRELLDAPQVTQEESTRSEIASQRSRTLSRSTIRQRRRLRTITKHLVRKSVWIVGGDGWAYDIGYGGLDHVLPRAGTSTSSCSTPRCIRIPAARPRSRLRAAAWPSLRRAASRAGRRISA